MTEPKYQGKSHDIPKRLVWDAWLKVKKNGGAAGVDGVTIEQFEESLKGNLFKLWNRMSSGSYFPGPVRAVEIPKKGGTRVLTGFHPSPTRHVVVRLVVGAPVGWCDGALPGP
ncbi:MAG: reverse transcriptase [Pseudonocardiaceae bacterium]